MDSRGRALKKYIRKRKIFICLIPLRGIRQMKIFLFAVSRRKSQGHPIRDPKKIGRSPIFCGSQLDFPLRYFPRLLALFSRREKRANFLLFLVLFLSEKGRVFPELLRSRGKYRNSKKYRSREKPVLFLKEKEPSSAVENRLRFSTADGEKKNRRSLRKSHAIF